MALRIGCDLDGVLADMDLAVAEAAARLFGRPEVPAWPPQGAPGAALPEKPQTDAAGDEAAGGPPDDVPDDEAAVPAARALTSRQQRQL